MIVEVLRDGNVEPLRKLTIETWGYDEGAGEEKSSIVL